MRQRKWMEYLEDYDITLHYHPNKENMVADALSQKSQGVLASVASRKWHMLEVMGLFRLHSRGQTQGTYGYAFPIEQSDRVLGTRHRDIFHQGLATVGYR